MSRSVVVTRRRSRLHRPVVYTAVALLVIAVLSPFLWLIEMSLKKPNDIFVMPPPLLFIPTLVNYTSIWGTSFLGAFGNSAIASVASTILALVIGVPAAYALARTRQRQNGPIALWVLATRMAPPIAFTIPFFLIYIDLGLIDTVAGLVIIYLTFNLSLVIWMMRAFFEGVPRSLEDAASIDGASVWDAFWQIVLPLATPGISSTAIFCFLFSWNDFFFALILTRTQAMTAPVAVVNFMNYEGWDWGKIASGGTIVMLPVVLFSVVVRRYLVRGLTAGALKG